MMDWYFGHDVGDLVVPKDQEYFDRLPSPDSWSQWGTCGLGNVGWPYNFDAEKTLNLPDEKPQECMSFGRGNTEINQPEGECSFGSSSRRVSSEDPHQSNSLACGRPSHHVNNLMEANPMDDIFLSSLLQDDLPAAAHNDSSLGIPSQSQCIMMPADSDSTNMILEFQSMSSDTDGAGNSKGFRTPPFSSSDCSDNGHVSILNIGYGNSSGQSNSSSVKALETTDMLPSDSRRCGDEDSSIEESVLLGLEAVLSQLSDHTRLCFRDSLYRLAQRSKQQLPAEAQVEGLPLERSAMSETGNGQTSNAPTSRSTRTGAVESETNTIDRAVASLMFNKVNANIHDHLPTIPARFEHHQGKPFAAGCNYGSNQPTNLPADSEVPVFRRQNPHNPSSVPSCAAEYLF